MNILWIVAFTLISMSYQSSAQQLTNTDMQVSSGTLQVYGDFRSKHVANRTVRVWLPEDYSIKQKYAVLYMHDGQMLFDANTTWNKQEWQVDEVAAKLQHEGKTRDFIVVGVDNGGELRHSEYFPKKALKYIPTNESNRNHPIMSHEFEADDYLLFLVQELKPFIDNTYSVYKDKDSTFVMGSSMGGLISMYAISEYPEVFGGAACISTHWPGIAPDSPLPVEEGFYGYMKKHLPDPDGHKIYFDHGTETLDKFYPPLQLEVDKIMRSKGYTENNWQTSQFIGADHSETYWAKRLHQPISFLLGKQNNLK